ncbi:hypothetical protein ACFYWN_46620, partial [Streptomyces sp. NPDC002917]|uniref:hypothetical protein n=1 Tax=Streptomyces sp. NPDC002917 TaxID=3364671 RepID=UPI00368A45E2
SRNSAACSTDSSIPRERATQDQVTLTESRDTSREEPLLSEGRVSSAFSEDEISRIADTFNLKHVDTTDDFLLFVYAEKYPIRQRDVAIPLSSASEILEAMDRNAERMEEFEGWVDPEKGFVEFDIRMQAIGAIRGVALEKFTFESHACIHTHHYSPPSESVGSLVHPVLRVTSPDGSTCIEISRNSPLAVPLLPVNLDARQSRTVSTLKVFLGGSAGKADCERRALDLANSFLFELNTRNRTSYALRPRLQQHVRRIRASELIYSVRFPKTSIPKQVAALFSAPSDAMRSSHTSSFLSYYQILEHYLPAVHKRETVRKVRRVLRSLDFDEEKDSSILKILGSVERAHGASEGEQLKVLIEECVPDDKLRAFFELDHGGHFGKKGPIFWISAIHLNSGESLSSQVSKRVYALRNRIVHAKDDARYAEASVLLPGSHEAMRLYPDVELVRTLAVEVIVDNR